MDPVTKKKQQITRLAKAGQLDKARKICTEL
jgi:hypothetical protein